jgi:repressor LexA
VYIVTSDIGKRISVLRRERGFTQDQLAEMSLVSRISLARYESGAIEPGALALSRIADALNVTTDEILCRTEKLPPFVQIVKSSVPIVGEIACGTPITAEQNIEGYADLPDGTRADFALKVRGDSMSPTFEHGDLVLIRQTVDFTNGQIVAIGVEGEAVLKHVYKQGEQITCVSENPAYAPQVYNAEDVTVYGLAVGYLRMW